jgi:hypothetical protein
LKGLLAVLVTALQVTGHGFEGLWTVWDGDMVSAAVLGFEHFLGLCRALEMDCKGPSFPAPTPFGQLAAAVVVDDSWVAVITLLPSRARFAQWIVVLWRTCASGRTSRPRRVFRNPMVIAESSANRGRLTVG